MYKKLYFILIDLLLIYWCFSLVSILFASGTDGQEYVSNSPTPVNGYAIIENTDAAIYSIDTGQSVNMVAPTIVNTTHVGGFSAILNNVKTFSSGFFFKMV